MIFQAELIRTHHRFDGTFGVFSINNFPFAVTCEREWLNNQKGISCIPTGRYWCKRVHSIKFGDTWEVTGVDGRTEILIHKGNIDDDSHGCIIVGEYFGVWSDGSCDVASSGEAHKELMNRTAMIAANDGFWLTIKDAA